MTWHWSLLVRATLLLALPQCGVSSECVGYLEASVTEMRQGAGSGCFELQHVVVVARTPSQSTPRVYVQDQVGGPYSAIRGKCDDSPTHPCSPETARQVASLLDGSQVTLRGYYLHGTLSGFEEIYLDQVVDEQTLLPVPTAASLGVGDLSRDARARASWFQVVSSQVSGQDPLVIYDFSPAEFSRGDHCPAWSGFAVIPASVATGSAADCGAGTNPRSVDPADGRELLIGREFYKEFFASTDCACALPSKQHLLTAASTLTGLMRGVLSPEIKPGSSQLYQVFHPLSKAAFPIVGG